MGRLRFLTRASHFRDFGPKGEVRPIRTWCSSVRAHMPMPKGPVASGKPGVLGLRPDSQRGQVNHQVWSNFWKAWKAKSADTD
eukprot:Skav204482  [mRNA]  locus=scaffold535:33703:37505:+ [translate_table: standard]